MSSSLVVEISELPPAGGHYSYATKSNGHVYVSGQLGRGPGMSDAEAGDIEVQVRRGLGSVATILRAAGSDLGRTLKVTIYISDIAHWPAVNSVYAEVLGEHRPARSIVPVGPLHFGALVEVEAVAVCA